MQVHANRESNTVPYEKDFGDAEKEREGVTYGPGMCELLSVSIILCKPYKRDM